MNNNQKDATAIAINRTNLTMKILLVTMSIVAGFIVTQLVTFSSYAQESFADLVEKVQPAVVNISTVQLIRAPRAPNSRNLPGGEQFEEFLEKWKNRVLPEDEPRKARSLGSGFIIDEEGYVVTNHHVIAEADEITIIMYDGTEFDAKVVGSDFDTDLALLKIESDKDFPSVEFGSSSEARIGDWVVAIGNPFGQGNSVTAGIISGRDRNLGARRDGNYVDFIQTDAPINKGNSGGPLFNTDGEVIGINSAIFSPTGGNIGIGFAIPSDDAARYIKLLKKEGKVVRGYLGVTIEPVNEDVAESLGLEAIGVLLSGVVPDGPADNAGLVVGDIILEWDDEEISDGTSLQRAVADTIVGEEIDVLILREGERETIEVKTGAKPTTANDNIETSEDEEPDEAHENEPEEIEGMVLMDINGAVRRNFDLDDDIDGVAVVRVSRRSDAFKKKIRPGFVIQTINLKRVENISDIKDLIQKARDQGKKNILVRLRYGNVTDHITLELSKPE